MFLEAHAIIVVVFAGSDASNGKMWLYLDCDQSKEAIQMLHCKHKYSALVSMYTHTCYTKQEAALQSRNILEQVCL